MKPATSLAAAMICVAALANLSLAGVALAQAPAAASLPADPWPRDVSLSNAAVLVYQPQVNNWTDNQIDFRAAHGDQAHGAKDETFGVVFATARTQVDKVARTVVFENLQITKSRLSRRCPTAARPTPPELQKRVGGQAAHRSRSTGSKPRSRQPASSRRRCEVQNNAPQVIVSYSPGDPGADRRRAGVQAGADDTPLPARHQHPRADPAGRARATASTCTSTTAGSSPSALDGPWTQSHRQPFGMDDARADSWPSPARSTCSTAAPTPTRSRRSPTACRRSTRQPGRRPSSSCSRASPTSCRSSARSCCGPRTPTSDVLIDTTNNNYYALLAGRWFRAPALTGPWTFVAEQRAAGGLREDSAGIRSPAPCCRPWPARRRRRTR